MKKRLATALICAAMMLGLLPATAFAVTDLSGEVSWAYALHDAAAIREGQTFSINGGGSPNLHLQDHTLDIYGTLQIAYEQPPALMVGGGTVNNYGTLKVVNNPRSSSGILNVNAATALYNYGTIDAGSLVLSGGSVLYDMTLSSLVLSSGTLSPAFAAGTRDYTATVESNVGSINITPTLRTGTGVGSLTVNGVAATSGSASSVALEYGPNTIPITVTASDTAGTTNTYTLVVTRTPLYSIHINTQPAASTTVTQGHISGSLSVAADVTGSGTPVYNWYACDASGATSGSSLAQTASFAIPTDLTAGTYHYLCRVTADGAVPMNSKVATVTVNNTPLTSMALFTNTPTVGTPITATVEPASATASYQWYKNNSASTVNGNPILNGGATASYTPQAGDVGMYLYCIATGTGSYTGTVSAVTTGAVPAYSLYYNNTDGKLHMGSTGGTIYSDEGDTWSGSGSTLTLSGLDFTTSTATALHLPAGTELVINGTNTVTSTFDGLNYSSGIECDGALTISGSGTLDVTGGSPPSNSSYGIYIDSDGVTIESGTVNATGSRAGYNSYGVIAATITVSDTGTLTGTGGEAINNSYGVRSRGGAAVSGKITVSGTGTLTGTGGTGTNNSCGVFAMNGDIEVSGGSLTGVAGTATSSSVGVYVNNDDYSLTVSGGSVTGTGGAATGGYGFSYGVRGDTAINIDGGTLVAKSSSSMSSHCALDRAPTLGTGITAVGSVNYNGIPAVAYDSAANATYKYFAAPGTPTPTVTSVMVSPSTASVAKGASKGFSATVTGTNSPAQAVTWTVEGGTASTIDVSGNLSVAASETAATLTVRAISTVDTTKSGTATVSVVTPEPLVTVSPSSLDFGSFTFGSAPAAQVITVTNRDSITMGFDLPTHTDFTILAVEGFNNGVALVPSGGSAKFSVQPHANLPVGTYNRAIGIVFRNSTGLDIPVSFTVTPSPIQYQITQGANGTWTKGDNAGLSFTANADCSKLESVMVDGVQIPDDKLTSASGSTIVTLKAAYLETLSAGWHTLRMNFTDGYAETQFTVNAATVIPKTGDDMRAIVRLAVLLIVGAGLVAGGSAWRRRQDG